VTGPAARPAAPDGKQRGVLADPLFRLLWAGEALASVSEQLFVICLTLLVLDAAGAGPTLGLVLAVAAVPRAVLLPFGGLLADRVAPARVVVVTVWLRTAVLAALAVLVLVGSPSIVAIAVLATVLGVLDAAYFPASMALLPAVVAPAGLARANSMVQGAESAGDLLGPALAAGIVTAFGFGGGLGTVAALYLLAAIALSAFARRLVRVRRAAASAPSIDPADVGTQPATPGLRALGEGVRFAWHEPAVRIMLLLLAVLNVAVVGPILVGGAVLAEQRLGGAGALATVFVGFGAGSVLGLVGAGVRAPRRRGLVLVCGTAVIGAGTAAFGAVGGLVAAIATAAAVGAGAAYLGVVLVAWLQELVPGHLRGRVMSLVVLATVAFDPLSFTLAGLLLPAGVTVMFAVCGLLILLTALAAFAVPAIRRLR
jgi:MFS family permease